MCVCVCACVCVSVCVCVCVCVLKKMLKLDENLNKTLKVFLIVYISTTYSSYMKPIVGEFAYYDCTLSKEPYYLIQVEKKYDCLIVCHYSSPLLIQSKFVYCLGIVKNVSEIKMYNKEKFMFLK